MQTRIPAWFPLWCIAILAMSAIATGRLAAAEPRPAKPSAEPAKGILKIEGTGIEQLTLVKQKSLREYDSPTVLQRPGSSVLLPAGKYILTEIRLKNGYQSTVHWAISSSNNYAVSDSELLTVSPEKACSVKGGGPLKLLPSLGRLGRTLHLGCQIVDGAGHSYTNEKRDNPPRFTVFCNGQEVGSGTFEYG